MNNILINSFLVNTILFNNYIIDYISNNHTINYINTYVCNLILYTSLWYMCFKIINYLFIKSIDNSQCIVSIIHTYFIVFVGTLDNYLINYKYIIYIY